MKLFVFHHAGGSAFSYAKFRKSFPEHFEVIVLEMPGRGSRIREPLMTDAEQVAQRLYEDIKTNLDEPYGFFGHSLGGLIAFLVLQRVIVEKRCLPVILFVSSCSAPSQLKHRYDYRLPSDLLWQMVSKIGGVTDEVKSNKALRALFEPVLRADFQTLSTYKYRKNASLSIPIIAFHGKNDMIKREQMLHWQTETEHIIKIYTFEGDHFYLLENDDLPIQTIIQEMTIGLEKSRSTDPLQAS